MTLKQIPLVSSIEFINFEPINPMISKATVKIMYTGKNRNQSYISRDVAEKMIRTLPNIPIVGQYNTSIKDFLGHGHDFTEDENGNIIPSKKTIPYGVVPSDTKIWWEKFKDDKGIEREYLCCYCYLWTGRYPEARRIIEKGKNNQSMELDPNTIQGEWTKMDKDGAEYFVIKDAVFSALCILGEDTEPCFEGSKFDPISFALSKDKTIDIEIQNLLGELKEALFVYKKEEKTDFPQKGDNETISLRNSKWKVFDPAYAAKIKEEHPEIWRLGGNIRGNSQYKKLSKITNKEASQLTTAEKDAIKLREAWVARHYKDYLIAGVIAQIKWLAVGSRGESFMKKVVQEEIDKREKRKKKNMNHSLYSSASELTNKMLLAIKKLDGIGDDVEELESMKRLDEIINELQEILDSFDLDDGPIQSDADLRSLESYKQKEEKFLKVKNKIKSFYEDEEMKVQMEEEIEEVETKMEEEAEEKVQMEEEMKPEMKMEEEESEDESKYEDEKMDHSEIVSKIEELLAKLKAPHEMAKEAIEDTASKSPAKRKHPSSNPVKAPEEEALLEKYGYLVMENEDLKAQLAELQSFKAKIEADEKTKMMEKFSALDTAFLADIKKKFNKYSLEELESKLAVEAVRSGIRIKTDTGVATYSRESEDINLPSWISAIEKSKH